MSKDKKELTPVVDRLLQIIAELKAAGKIKSHKDFAEKIKINNTYLSDVFGGRRGPLSDKMLSSVQDVFGVSKAWLQLGVGEPYLQVEDDESIILLRSIASDVSAIKKLLEENTTPMKT